MLLSTAASFYLLANESMAFFSFNPTSPGSCRKTQWEHHQNRFHLSLAKSCRNVPWNWLLAHVANGFWSPPFRRGRGRSHFLPWLWLEHLQQSPNCPCNCPCNWVELVEQSRSNGGRARACALSAAFAKIAFASAVPLDFQTVLSSKPLLCI